MRHLLTCCNYLGLKQSLQVFRNKQVTIAMGRSFENRKASIFKTAGIKSKIYSKYGTQLYVAAKNGVPNPAKNPALRTLSERAKRYQVPRHLIEKSSETSKGVC